VNDEPSRAAESRAPVSGTFLAVSLAVAAAAMLGAACLGWAGVPILVTFLGAGCALLLRWSR
jgi:hypothetical protein